MNKFNPAFSSYPMQDKFGQIIVNFGLSKVELLTAIIAAGSLNLNVSSETIAQSAYTTAVDILDKCEEEFIKEGMTNQNNNIIS